MELQFLTFIALSISFLIVLVFVVSKTKQSRNNHLTFNLPPGPRGLPLIGNLHQLLGSQLPHHRLRDLAKKHGPLMQLQLGEVLHIIVTSPEAAREIMKTHDTSFASRPFAIAGSVISYNCTNIGLSPYGDYWRRLRKICTLELLSAKRVQSFRSISEEEASNLIASITSSSSNSSTSGLLPVINLSKMLFYLVYGVTTRVVFGMKCQSDQEQVMEAFHKIMELGAGFSLADVFPSAKWLAKLSGIRPEVERQHKSVDMILENVINEHKESRAAGKNRSVAGDEEAEDLVHVLLNFQDQADSGISLTNNNF